MDEAVPTRTQAHVAQFGDILPPTFTAGTGCGPGAARPRVGRRPDGACQRAACLCGGATRISVVLGERHDVDIALLQALNGVAEYLNRRGGELTLEGVQPRVGAKIAAHGLSRLSAADASRREQLA
jgi:hypothetical protein